MVKVKEQKVDLHNFVGILDHIEFSDTFTTTNHSDSLEKIANLIFNNPPQWIKSLFTLRNRVVGLFGLKTEVPDDYTDEFKVGGYVMFFKIFNIESNHLILGADDSHLKFRVKIENTEDAQHNIKVTTLVEFNN